MKAGIGCLFSFLYSLRSLKGVSLATLLLMDMALARRLKNRPRDYPAGLSRYANITLSM